MATTISVSEETRDKIRNLGRVGDTYDDVINRMLDIVKKHMVDAYLYDEKNTTTIDDAIKESKTKWQKS